MAWSQSNRPAEVIVSSLEKDTLLLHRFYGKESISSPFEFHLDLLSENSALDFDTVLGATVAVRLNLPKAAPKTALFRRQATTASSMRDDSRWFHGMISEFSQVPTEANDHPKLSRYRAVMSPAFWFLSLQTDCRIFQDQKVPDIAKELLRNVGIEHVMRAGTREHQPREYCVQYNESTFHFISRLLEFEGIHYYFLHEENSHTLVMADGDVPHASVKGYKTIRFNPNSEIDHEHVWSWSRIRRIQPDKVSMKDFDFKVIQQCLNPRSSLLTEKPMPRPDKGPALEVFEYPGRYVIPKVGESYARIRMEEFRSRYETFTGKTNARGIAPGRSFTLANHSDAPMNREYLITSCDYKIQLDDYQETAGKPVAKRAAAASAEAAPLIRHLFECTFTAMALDETVRYQPARVTPKPVVKGPQTAIVTTSKETTAKQDHGPASKQSQEQGKDREIQTDKFGRVKVHFFWDRHRPQTAESSCWLRVSMPWAGKGWGGVQIPRKDQEVIVDFLEGDPDQPIITGRVYNAATMPPLSGAGRPGSPPSPANMEAAAQQMSMRSNSLGQGGGAAKGNEITMNDDEGGETMFMHAEKDETHNVNNDRLDTVGANEVRHVTADRTRTVGGNEKVTIGANETVAIGANASETVTVAKVIDVGTTLLVKAGVSITFQCGASTIHMNQAGFITISGMVISIAGGVTCNMAAPITTVTGGIALVTNGGVFNVSTAGVNHTTISGGKASVTGTNTVIHGKTKAQLVSDAETDVVGPIIKLN